MGGRHRQSPAYDGDQIYTGSAARAEVHVPGTAFRLGDRTTFEFMNVDDRSVQVRLSAGTLVVRVRNLFGTIEIDTPNLRIRSLTGRPLGPAPNECGTEPRA